MNKTAISIVAYFVVFSLTQANAQVPILAVGDPLLAIDFDASFQSNYPMNENPFNLFDGDTTTKYLNFGKENSGIIVTPVLFGPSVIQSMVFSTANDFEERDPASWELYGTNSPITSMDNSDGMEEPWTLISSGMVNMPAGRETAGPTLSFSNATSYTSYRLTFPTLKDGAAANSLQLSEVAMFESNDGSGTSFVDFFDNAIAVDIDGMVPESNYPPMEGPANLLDGDTATKYLNFGRENSGFIVTPAAGPSVVDSFQITTANDFEDRDPSSWELYGTNDPIMSTDNSVGDGESWTLIDSGALSLPLDRFTAGDVVSVDNTTEYASYRMVFPTVRNPDGDFVDSTQYSEFQFFGTVSNVVDGDFNNDGAWDCLDINALTAAVAAGSADLAFDMNGDGQVTAEDVTDAGTGWLAVGGANNPGATGGNPFLVGDANLDGVVDGQDFIAWNGSKFTAEDAWCSGDFTADGVVDGQDFIAWNQNKFTSSDGFTAVPEPHAGMLMLVAALTVLRRRKA